MYAKESALNSNARWIWLAKVGLAVSLGLLIPALRLPQPITGPLVNALLILTVLGAGVPAAIVVGVVTPLVALLNGVLPLPLLVLIPFIALANAAYVLVFGALRSRNYWLGLACGSVLKCVLLFAAVTWLVQLTSDAIAGGKAASLPHATVGMMQWPQLATALAGGVLAYGAAAAYRRLRR